jgi:glucosamine--fructose-6-phosphate aminotransferase (isomerizing)
MCGIVAVLARPSLRRAPAATEVADRFSDARAQLACLAEHPGPASPVGVVLAATETLKNLDALLRGVPGLTCLLGDSSAVEALRRGVSGTDLAVSRFEEALDGGEVAVSADQLEEVNAAIVQLRDTLWALGHDRLDAAEGVSALAEGLGFVQSGGVPAAALGVLWAVHVAFRSLDRLEVRGRDSAGLHLMLAGHALDLSGSDVQGLLAPRTEDPLFRSRGVRVADGCLSIVYKAAAEIGELGDNVAALRRGLVSDPLLARALRSPGVTATVVAHTRWASVGLISEANAHPLNSDEVGVSSEAPYVIAALNGDIDNYTELLRSERISVPVEVTTDAKLVPTLVSRQLATGEEAAEAFRLAVDRFDGSLGIAANASCAPGELLLALRGSGQSLNIGLAEDAFIVASEPYGLVEETSSYLRMDGEGGGQVVVCRTEGAGTLEGLTRRSHRGHELPVSQAELKQAEITTRDVDRRGFKHFLLKEISESPLSVRKTLRAKLVFGENGEPAVHLGDDVIPPSLRRALAAGSVHDAVVIGQGTAAVAGQAVAGAVERAFPHMAVKAMPATELSGWGMSGTGLADDMSTTLVIAISQSGTTTDTNRTVDLVRDRGAHVVSIVNRRNSDLVQKSHGVLYTSDGRDVEMAVASTKAFYSQVAAGYLLAAGLATAAGVESGTDRHKVLAALRDLPSLMQEVLNRRPAVAKVASALAPSRRSWAVVGSGPDWIAAAEVRIKLSELCYKAIALDTAEDKKHIDLSSEPLVVVCAASARGPNAQDIAKEIEIFRAHKAAPVVIVPDGQVGLFKPGVELLPVPPCHPELAFVLAAMVGHLFAYEAALAIDAQARPLREVRAFVERAVAQRQELSLAELASSLEVVAAPALAGLRSGSYDGHLNASTAERLTLLLRYATGILPVEGYEAEMGKVGAPSAIAADLMGALGAAIDELTRPVDAIKHQAKTVTVGISRSEGTLMGAKLVVEALAAGASMGSLGYRSLRTLAALGPVVDEVLGYTRYMIEGWHDAAGAPVRGGEVASITVVDRGGIARDITSRTERDNTLRGTKHRVAEKREVTVFSGLHDARTGVMVPEVKDGQVTGLTLLHVRFVDRVGAATAKAVLQAYQGRYTALVDAVTETEPDFDDAVLATVPTIELFTEPVAVLAKHWAGRWAC